MNVLFGQNILNTTYPTDSNPKTPFTSELEKWVKVDPVAREEPASRIQKAFENKEIALNLNNLSLFTIPPCIGKLTHLEQLDLGCNNLETLPPEIAELSRLTSLNLSANNLESLPKEIGTLSQLNTLDLTDNSLSTLPSNLRGLTQLTCLHLGYNKFKSLPKEIGELSQLTKLNLDFNRLETLPREIGALSQLTRLDLIWNDLKALPPQIKRLSKLKTLQLHKNKLKTLPPEIGELSQLEHLNLSLNKLESLPQKIRLLSQLNHLDLSLNKLSSLPLGIEQLSELETLNLSSNKFKFLQSQLWGLAQLKVLSLDHNKLSSLPPKINLLEQLENLNLDSNDFKFLPSELGKLRELKQLHANENKKLKELPLSLGQIPNLMKIDIEDTGVNKKERRAILNLCKTLRKNSTDLQIFSHRLELWKLKSKEDFTSLKASNFAQQKAKSLNLWLARLENTEDLNCKIQEPLAKTVCAMLLDASKNEDFASLFFSQIETNLTCCQDRAAMALNEIFTSWKLANLKNSTAKKEKLQIMISGAKTNALRAAISQSIDEHQCTEGKVLKEATEIYLYYEIALREELNLLSITESMAYAPVGKKNWIKEEDLIEQVNETYLDYLIENDFFEKVIKNDRGYNKAYKKRVEPIENKIEKLFDKKPQNIEEDSDKYLSWETKIGALNAKRGRTIVSLKKRWVQNTLNG